MEDAVSDGASLSFFSANGWFLFFSNILKLIAICTSIVLVSGREKDISLEVKSRKFFKKAICTKSAQGWLKFLQTSI